MAAVFCEDWRCGSAELGLIGMPRMDAVGVLRKMTCTYVQG